MHSLDTLRVDNFVLNPNSTVIEFSLAITDYLFEVSASSVANITTFDGEPIFGVILEPSFATITTNGLFVKTDLVYINKYLLYYSTVLIIGFNSTNFVVNEDDGHVMLSVYVRGGTNRCNKMEWSLNYTIRNISAQREHLQIWL